MKIPKPENVVQLAWLLRADLRRGEPASGSVPEWFRLWWATQGHREYPAWPGLVGGDALGLLTPLPDWPRYGQFGMTAALNYLLEQREDLRAAFDVTTEAGLWQAIAWFFTHGLREHGLMEVVDAATLAALHATPPFLCLPDDAASHQPPLTWLMFFVWRSAADLQAAFDLRTRQGQAAYLQWFLFEGVSHLHLEPLVGPRLVIASRPSVIASEARQSRLLNPPTVARPFGLNLIGFAFGELGIGEDVRMAVAACEAAGIPFAVVNIHPGENLRQADRALAAHVGKAAAMDEAPYAINLFCMTGFDTARMYLERGLPLFGGRYNIGWWPWELPVWPKDWQMAFDLVDEVWAATEFTRAMYIQAQRKSVSPVPVTLMPLPASVTRVKAMTRRQLGLPAHRFLFLYVFDFNSYLARKNPFAALKAFHCAFVATDDSVGLVLKTMNSNPKNPAWKRFVQACMADARIVLLDKTLERGKVLGLIQACDAYVSLHRSEGFGRTLAEAMLLGKPVVGTNFSGNVDFLTDESGFPVKWKRRVVKPGEYPFVTEADAAWWAEPDIADAARQMRAAHLLLQAQCGNPSFSVRVRQFAEEQFSPQRIGKLMRERVAAIYQTT